MKSLICEAMAMKMLFVWKKDISDYCTVRDFALRWSSINELSASAYSKFVKGPKKVKKTISLTFYQRYKVPLTLVGWLVGSPSAGSSIRLSS
jgi:hypothetical protein